MAKKLSVDAVSRGLACAPAPAEKIPEQGCAFFAQHPGGDYDLVIEQAVAAGSLVTTRAVQELLQVYESSRGKSEDEST